MRPGLRRCRMRRSSGSCPGTRRLRGGSICPRRARCMRAGHGQPRARRRLDPVFRDRRRDGFREPGCSKERRLEPQITVGLLTDQAGFPLMVSAFGEQGPDQDDAAGDRGVHDRPPAAQRRCGRRRRHGVGGHSEGDRGRRAVVHSRHADPARPLCRSPVAP